MKARAAQILDPCPLGPGVVGPKLTYAFEFLSACDLEFSRMQLFKT